MHATCAVATGEQDPVNRRQIDLLPADRGAELGRILHLRVGVARGPVSPQGSADGHHAPQYRHESPESRPSPVSISSSARAICPWGVANTILWPSRAPARAEPTATSVGSKSTAGVGIKTLAVAPAPTRYVEAHQVTPSPARRRSFCSPRCGASQPERHPNGGRNLATVLGTDPKAAQRSRQLRNAAAVSNTGNRVPTIALKLRQRDEATGRPSG